MEDGHGPAGRGELSLKRCRQSGWWRVQACGGRVAGDGPDGEQVLGPGAPGVHAGASDLCSHGSRKASGVLSGKVP